MSRPVVALLTDFGSRDHYAGTMKGVVLGICPEAALVDITHEIPPQDVLAGALELAAACPYFPPGTVFLAVVDPGVGSARRPIAVEAGAYRFVAPDNGILAPALDGLGVTRAVELRDPRFARADVSRTFEGRDRFAPAAAWLAAGIDLGALGPPAAGLVRIDVPRPEVGAGEVGGEVVRVDRFGNLVTNIDRGAWAALAGESFDIRVGGHRVARLVTTYAEAAPGEPCALFGSTGHLEIAVTGASAAVALGAGRGAAVHVVRRA